MWQQVHAEHSGLTPTCSEQVVDAMAQGFPWHPLTRAASPCRCSPALGC